MKKKKVPDFSRTFSAWWSQQDSNQRSRYASLARSGSQSASCFAAACMTCCSLRLRLAYSATGGASAPRPIDVNDVLYRLSHATTSAYLRPTSPVGHLEQFVLPTEPCHLFSYPWSTSSVGHLNQFVLTIWYVSTKNHKI